MNNIKTDEKLAIVHKLLAEKKAQDVETIDLRERTLIADYFVVCSGTSNTHIKSIIDALTFEAKQRGLTKDHVEGDSASRWVLVDYGDIVVHVFAPEEREYYDIESLWRETAVRLEGTSQ